MQSYVPKTFSQSEEYKADLRQAIDEKAAMEKEIKAFLEKKETVYTPELDKLIREMYLTTPVHVNVYPTAPLPGQIVVPTAGLAKCLCVVGCEKKVPQPEYYSFGNAPGDERWCEKNMIEEQLQSVHDAWLREHCKAGLHNVPVKKFNLPGE